MGSVADLYTSVRADMSAFDSDLQKGLTKSADKSAKTFGSRFSSQAKRLAGPAVGAALGVGLADAAGAFSAFQNKMNEVFTLLPGISQPAMDKMSGQVKDFANEFGVLPEEVVPALYNSLSAGVPPDNVFEFLEVANKAAKGGVVDLDTAVNGLTTVVNAFGADTIDAARASDVLFTTVRLGKTTMGELSASMSNVAPIAAALGVDFGDVGAALAAMTAQGTPTSVATTQLRAAFVELSKASSGTSKLFTQLSGSTFKDFIAQGGNVQDALQLLESHAADAGVGINDLFGSVEAGSAVLQLTGKGTELFTTGLGQMETATGATDAAFARMESGVTAVTNRIAARMRTLAIDVGSALEPVAPLLLSFGPTIGRALGGAFGAGFGLLATHIPRLMAPVVARIVAALGATTIGQGLVSSLSGSLTSVKAAGRTAGLAYGAAFIAAAVVIAAELDQLFKTVEGIKEAQAVIDAAEKRRDANEFTIAELHQQLANLRQAREDMKSEGFFEGFIGNAAFDADILGARSGIERQEQEIRDAIKRQYQRAAQESRFGARDAGETAGEALVEGVVEGITSTGNKSLLPAVTRLSDSFKVMPDVLARVSDRALRFAQRIADAIVAVAAGGVKGLKKEEKDADKAWKNIIGVGDKNKRRLGEIKQDIDKWERRMQRAIRNNDSEAYAYAVAQRDRLEEERKQRQVVVNTVNRQFRALTSLPKKTTTTVVVNGERTLDRIITKIRGLTSGEAVVTIGGQVYGGIGGRATGGPVAQHTPYIVGERGPEVFVPNTSGRVEPNHKIGGDTYNITPHIYGLPQQVRTPREVVAELRRSATVGIVAQRPARGFAPA